MQVFTNVAAQLLRENWSIVWGTFSGLLAPQCSTSRSVDSLVTLKAPTQKGSACPTLLQSQSCDDGVTRSMVDNDFFLL